MNDRRDVQSAGWLRRALPALGLGALVLLFLLERVLWTSERLGGNSVDLRFYFYPLYEVTFEAMASGRFPLWNPHHLAGLPQLATLQGGFFYPPHAVYLLLPTPVGMALSHLFHLALIALSTFAFGRKAGLGRPAAALAAILFTFSGTLQWWLFWPNMLEAGAWLPVGGIAVLGLARGVGLRAACGLAFACAMSLLAGHTQVTVLVVTAWVTLLVALRIGAGAGVRGEVARAAVFGAALMLGVVVSGIQTFPSLALTLEGTRTATALPEVQAQSFGMQGIDSVAGAMSGSRFAFGAIALALAPAALLVRRQRRLALWALGLAIVTGALAMGSGTPLMKLYLALPGIGWFRQPHRLLFLTHFAVALVAGVAFDGLLGRAGGGASEARQGGARPRGWRSAGGRALPVACAVALAACAALAGAVGSAVRALAAAAAIALCGFRPARLAPGLAVVAVLGVAGLDLWLATSLREPLPYTAAWSKHYRRDDDLMRNLASVSREDRAVWLLFRVDPDTKRAARYGLRRLDDFEPLNLRRQSEYFAYLQVGDGVPAQSDRFFSGSILPQRHLPGDQLVEWYAEMATRRRLLDLAAVRWFVLPGALRRSQLDAARAFVEAAGLVRREFADPGVGLYENPRALPRAYVTYRAVSAPDTATLLERLSRDDFDPLALSYVEGEPGFAAAATAPARGAPARITRDEETVIEIEAELEAPGLLVLADSYAAGWRVQVDGAPASARPANFLFRGVPVPAGRHRVRFEYRPRSVTVGAAASLGGGALLAVLALFASRRDRARAERGGRSPAGRLGRSAST